jgi:hypothetical protein
VGRRLPAAGGPQPLAGGDRQPQAAVQGPVKAAGRGEMLEPVGVRKGALPAAVLAAVEERLREGRVMLA